MDIVDEGDAMPKEFRDMEEKEIEIRQYDEAANQIMTAQVDEEVSTEGNTLAQCDQYCQCQQPCYQPAC
jgi:hypothetical protein